MMKTKDPTKDIAKNAEATSGGGHIGGTHVGQVPDAKTTSIRDDKGNKARPNNGKN